MNYKNFLKMAGFTALVSALTIGSVKVFEIGAPAGAATNVNVVAGSVRQGDGGLLNPGTGDWTSGKLGVGRYFVDVQPPSTQAVILTATPIDDFGGQSHNNIISTYNHDHAQGIVYITCTDVESGQLQDCNFSFTGIVQ